MVLDTTRQPASGYITYEEYLQDEGENHCTEWVDGKVIDISMVSAEHDDLNLFLLLLLQIWVQEHQAGVVHGDPFNMKTGPTLPGRSPDAMYIAQANRSRIRHTHLSGPCDLAVEVISPESRTRDTVEKFQEYAQGGVPEYWIIDHEVRQARFYGVDANGGYQEIPVGADGILHSHILPGLWLNVAWLWQRPLPTARELLRAWNLL